MKKLLLVFLVLSSYACDTPKSSATSKAAAPESAYVSPPVYTDLQPVEALPADSIPVSYTARGVAVAPVGFNDMMGEWVSTYDEDEVVRFAPGKYISYYQGTKVVEEAMTYYQVCPEACNSGEALSVPCFVLASDYGQNCFAVINQTNELLELSDLSGSGAVLTYNRKQEN
ncbi:MAG: hypothetical protein AAFP77_21930 [Bacteroidota bacterium]